jgi:hypothetical protein
MVPPYWGVPRLSHQFPVEVAVVAVVIGELDVVVVIATVVVVVVIVEVATVVVVDAAEFVVALVVVDEEQDPITSDITMRRHKAIQIVPLFILPPFLV